MLTETNFIEEPYMNIQIKRTKRISGIHTIHTINVMNNIIAVDGIHWSFRPFFQIKEILTRKLNLKKV